MPLQVDHRVLPANSLSLWSLILIREEPPEVVGRGRYSIDEISDRPPKPRGQDRTGPDRTGRVPGPDRAVTLPAESVEAFIPSHLR
jgi:hypothetical protein